MNDEVQTVIEPAWKVLDHFAFGTALDALRAGKKVTREGWNGEGMYIELQIPDQDSKMKLPYIYISTVDCTLVPWVASHTDILDIDWKLVKDL